MRRKRICVLLGQMEEDKQARFMQAFLEEAFAADYDVCVFSMCQKYQEIALRDLGDSNIYQLVNYALFDAVVILLDRISGILFKDRYWWLTRRVTIFRLS